MSRPTLDDGRIGPELNLEDVRLPPHVGGRLAAFYGRERRLETAQEWADAVDDAIRAEQGRPATEADMCTAADGAHTVAFPDATQSFVCVLDPLMTVFLRNEPGTVRSTTPADGATVEIDITADGVAVDPAEAVFSLGVGQTDGDPTLNAAYGQLCAYTHAFASPDEYERWAASVDAATTSLTPALGVGLVRELVALLPE